MGDVFIGLDLGTSSAKAIAIDSGGSLLAQASAPLEVSRPQPGWSEQSPADWWQAARAALLALPAPLRAAARGLGLSGQMHGATLLGARDRVLRPAILWNDGRSEPQCAELERREPRLRSITGNLAMPGFTAPKLLWVAEHEPEVFAAVERVLLPKDYLRLLLTGEAASDMSDAAGTLWLDVARRDWSDEALAATGLARRHMPGLAEGPQATGTLLPGIARELGMDRIVVAAGGGDNAASAVGLGLVDAGQALLSLGTSGVLFVVTDRFRPNPQRAAHAFCHALPGRWHQMAVMLSAASAIDWAAAATGHATVVDAAAAAAARGLRADTPHFLPYLSGERTPHNDARARGAWVGMGGATGRDDLVVAALEGVAHGMADGLAALLEAGGTPDSISLVGGGARLPWWPVLMASALGRPLLLREGGEVGAALGAARLGQLAATGADPAATCRAPPVRAQVDPDPSLVALLARRRTTWAGLYRQLKDTFRELPA